MRINKIICDICKKEIDISNDAWMSIKVSNTDLRPEYQAHDKCFCQIFEDPVDKDVPKEPPFVKCSWYHVIDYNSAPDRLECWRTMEHEECTCNGNKWKCNFYKYNPKTDKFEDI